MGHEAVHDAPASPPPDAPARWHGRRAPPPPVRGPAGTPCLRMGNYGISWDHLGVNEQPGRMPQRPGRSISTAPLTGCGLKEWLRLSGRAASGGRAATPHIGVDAMQAVPRPAPPPRAEPTAHVRLSVPSRSRFLAAVSLFTACVLRRRCPKA